MTIEEFFTEESKNLVKFIEYMKTNHPNLEDMPGIDWFDQYMSFINFV